MSERDRAIAEVRSEIEEVKPNTLYVITVTVLNAVRR